MKSTLVAFTLLSFAIDAQAVSHSEPHRHGEGYLSIEIDGSELALSLKVPSVNIVGFERNAETDDERAAIAAAISDLSNPLELFVLPIDAGCAAMSANVARVGDAFGQESTGDDEIHTEFQAEYSVQCQNVAGVNMVEFAFFDRFPDTRSFRVKVVSQGGMRIQEVKPQQPVLDISEPT